MWDNKLLNTNNRGLRGERYYDYQKPKDKLRILILGDSFTFGDEVSDNETWPAVLEKIANKKVVNGGVFGYGIDQSFLRMKVLVAKYNPDIVIFSFIPAGYYFLGLEGALWGIVLGNYLGIPLAIYLQAKYNLLDIRKEFITLPVIVPCRSLGWEAISLFGEG